MNFTDALKTAKTSAAIALETWETGRFVFYTPESRKTITGARTALFGSEVTYTERMSLRMPDGSVTDWRPSTNETQAVNWVVVN